MIGKAYKSRVPFYDRKTKSTKFKSRPCLIIGKSDEQGDYVVLPISSVSDKSKINPEYDIFLENSKYSFLDKDCYLRTHKQTVVNIASLRDEISDFKKLYEDTYIEVLAKVEKFQNELVKKAM